MDNNAYKTIPLDVAMEHYADGMRRGKAAGEIDERKRIEAILRTRGLYEALLAIKNADKK